MAFIDRATFGGAVDSTALANLTRAAVNRTLDGMLRGPQDILRSGDVRQIDTYVGALQAANIQVDKVLGTDLSTALRFPITLPPGVRAVMHPGSLIVQADGQVFRQSAQADRTMTSLTPEQAQQMFSDTVRHSIERNR
jgi:hypothetical protein